MAHEIRTNILFNIKYITFKQINGTGFVAHLMRKLLYNFNTNTTLIIDLNNEKCLPNPQITPLSYVFIMFIDLLFGIFNIFFI